MQGNTISRRNWLKASFLTTAGITFLPGETQAKLLHQAQQAALSLEGQSPTEERYWELVQQHFSFENGLHYFNTASLGPSPTMVRQATQGFRDTMDSFPSKYGWGAWKEEKEKVREKAAALLQVNPEEIALTHNTTEGMNLVASSLDLQA